MRHVEFPLLAGAAGGGPETHAATAWVKVRPTESLTTDDRRALAAFLREAMRQADEAADNVGNAWQELAAIANNLHTPPPPPPTLAEAREAARQLGGANAEVVHAFLASLGEGRAQP